MTLERLWAGWRSEYVEGAASDEGCVFCRILASDEAGEVTYIVRRDEHCAVVLNAFPYTTGHLMVMPVRHVADLEALDSDEAAGLWRELADAVRALKAAYSPDGLNVGANLGRSAGAGVPGHFHMHCVPRWTGDTNFMTTLAETRTLPEALPATYEKIRKAWPTNG
ncbi:MAG TPA: HIT domain-containing protein [Acidimicrobiales bacterium]|nr:HIT domain-containing protein [Acidimicrobiales bacterium]